MGASICNCCILFLKVIIKNWAIWLGVSIRSAYVSSMNLQRPPYDSVKRLKDFDFIFESKWSRLVKKAWMVCHAATAANVVLSISVALMIGHSVCM
jgi:hypothetical protein